MQTALVVGGTGPTGPFIVNGLRERGYRVTIFHRGTHEIRKPRWFVLDRTIRGGPFLTNGQPSKVALDQVMQSLFSDFALHGSLLVRRANGRRSCDRAVRFRRSGGV